MQLTMIHLRRPSHLYRIYKQCRRPPITRTRSKEVITKLKNIRQLFTLANDRVQHFLVTVKLRIAGIFFVGAIQAVLRKLKQLARVKGTRRVINVLLMIRQHQNATGQEYQNINKKNLIKYLLYRIQNNVEQENWSQKENMRFLNRYSFFLCWKHTINCLFSVNNNVNNNSYKRSVFAILL